MINCDTHEIKIECDQDSKCRWDRKSNKCKPPSIIGIVIEWVVIVLGILALFFFLFQVFFSSGGSDSSPDRSMLGEVAGNMQKTKENIDFMQVFGGYD